MKLCPHILPGTCPFIGIGLCCKTTRQPTEDEVKQYNINKAYLDSIFYIPRGKGDWGVKAT